MGVVDGLPCSYCGGCVSLCPVGAITLRETHLTVDDSCIDCGLCVPACPVGAIATEALAVPSVVATPPAASYDVVIVGAARLGLLAGYRGISTD